jgi:class 3 adenylate cyclase
MLDRHELFRSFVPRLLINHIKSRVLDGEENLKATSFFFQGVCLIVDISGFTALSEGFCDAGKLGIDGLQVCTNGYIGDLVAIVQSHGGDIVKFAGDALICVFAEERFTSGTRSKRRELVDAEVLIRALMCAQEVRNVRTDRLTVHVGMSCGEMCFGILGGVENRWECLISGPCIHELSGCLDDAPSMQVVMTAHCSEAVRTCAAVQRNGSKEGEAIFNVVRPQVQYEVTLQPLASRNWLLVDISTSFRTMLDCTKKQVSFVGSSSTAPGQLDEHQKLVADALVRHFVPAPIVEELDSATGLSYFAEIREVVTMFMKVSTVPLSLSDRFLTELLIVCF